uniref:Calsyntenin-2 n=1 Tax=Astyanax mexicanus TaxID=7994 RepID=A0A8B9H8Z4_ASTMX
MIPAMLYLITYLIYNIICIKLNKHKPWIETSYHGVITENMDTVLLDPPLVALDKDAPVPYAGEICAFKIHGQEAPFEAEVLNRTSGEGVLRARGPIDCEQQKEYTFIIQAYDCGSGPTGAGWKKSHKAVVHIQVDDVNEFSPVFREPVYRATVTEGKIYDSILQVEAWDQDCSPQYSQICNYEIVTQDTPFAIDRNGNIRNTERLSFDKQQHYKILVTAYDCGQKRASESVPVHIDVKPVCKPGWQGQWPFLFFFFAVVRAQPSNIHFLYFSTGAASGSTDLLPAPSASTNWTASLLTDSGRDSDLIFRFDGRQAANIPERVVPQNLTDQFTIATWMKHGPSPGLRAEKETLLCNSDKTEMNRHHYSLYVHNCRLVFLLRRDFTQMDTFRPAEFHWKLEQICDKEWHYYVINVEFPAVTLFVDGVTYEPYLVTDDWPIHPSQIDVQLTVGACWQGEDTCISIPDIKAVVMVLPPSEPRITIAGVERATWPASELRTPAGITLFKDIRIISTITKSDNAFSSGTAVPGILEVMHNLDYCDVLVIGEELNPEHESLEIHHSSLLGKHLDATNSTSGISIYGVDSMAHYEQAIRQVRYRNWRPAGLSERRFRLSCSELNGRYTSNEFNLEIGVLHSSEPVEHVNHMAAESQYMRPVHHPLMVHTINSDHISGTPPAATVVIVMCIAALVVIVVLGIYRIHTTHQEATKEDEEGGKEPEMDWDDSTLTITVNPMEVCRDGIILL